MASPLSATRLAVAARITFSTDGASLTIPVNRAILGWDAHAVSEDNLYDDLVANGPLALIGLVTFDVDYRQVGDAKLSFRLFFSKSKQVDFTGADIQDLIENMKGRLLTQSEYTSTALVPMQVAFVGYDYDIESTPGILTCDFELTFLDPEVKPEDTVEV